LVGALKRWLKGSAPTGQNMFQPRRRLGQSITANALSALLALSFHVPRLCPDQGKDALSRRNNCCS